MLRATGKPHGEPARGDLPLDSKHARREGSLFYGRDMRVFSFTATLPTVISSGWVGGVDSMIRESRMARGGSSVWNPKSRRLRHARRRFSWRTLLSVCNMSLRTVGNRSGPSGHPQTLVKYAKTPPKRSNWAKNQRFDHLSEPRKISDFDLELRRRFCSDTAQLWTYSRAKKVWD